MFITKLELVWDLLPTVQMFPLTGPHQARSLGVCLCAQSLGTFGQKIVITPQISGHACHKRCNQVIKWKNKKKKPLWNKWMNFIFWFLQQAQYCSPHSALGTESCGVGVGGDQRGGRGEGVGVGEERGDECREGKDDEMTFKLAILKYWLEQFPRMFS